MTQKTKWLRFLPFAKDGLRPLLEKAPDGTEMVTTAEWLSKILQWLRGTSWVPTDYRKKGNERQAERLRYLLDTIEREPALGVPFVTVLQSSFESPSVMDLFCRVGLVEESGIFSEAMTRILRKLLPTPPLEDDFAEIFSQLFYNKNDPNWIQSLPAPLIGRLVAQLENSDPKRSGLTFSMIEALLVLSSTITSLGVAPLMRKRTRKGRISDLPFVALNRKIFNLSEDFTNNGNFSEEKKERYLGELRDGIASCHELIKDVFSHLEEYGVSVDLVYALESQTDALNRVESIIQILLCPSNETHNEKIALFVSQLIRENQANRTLGELIRSNLHLLSRKIVERTGATGEHYITRNRTEYMKMLASAGGGGVVTVGTTLLKLIISRAHLPPFFEGFFSWVNYGGSFVFMQFCGFTLATKQPSMTASALAGKILALQRGGQKDDFVNEVIRITRSQFAAALGNLGIAIPVALVLVGSLSTLWGMQVLDEEYANKIIHSLHPWQSLTLPLAALTGVLLWASSIMAGWFENWIVFKRVPDAIRQNHRLRSVLGKKRAEGLSLWFHDNAAGFAGNISLGFFLAFTPIMGGFFGLPIDVRHVTLSAAALSCACFTLGLTAIDPTLLFAAWGGILMIGLLNFGISFLLALGVAARARNVKFRAIWPLVVSVILALFKSPKAFFLPPKESDETP